MRQILIKYCLYIIGLVTSLLFKLPIIPLILLLRLLSINNIITLNTSLKIYLLALLIDFMLPLSFGLNTLTLTLFLTFEAIAFYFVDIPEFKTALTKNILFSISFSLATIITNISYAITPIKPLQLLITLLLLYVVAWAIILICKKLK